MSSKIEVNGYKFPTDLYYSDRHLWVRKEGDNELTVGIDDLGQKLAGKVSIVTLTEAGQSVDLGKVFGVMESMKWIERLRSPVTGTILSVNAALSLRPQIVNEDPYGLGWMVKIKATQSVDKELLKLVAGEAIRNWALKEVQEKAKSLGK